MSIGSRNISFNSLKNLYRSKSGEINDTNIRLSDFRGALFTDKTYIADNHQTYSIGSLFKNKEFSDRPYLTYHSHKTTPKMNFYHLIGTWPPGSSGPENYRDFYTISLPPNITHNQESWVQYKVIGNGNLYIQLDYNTEFNYDWAYIYINGAQIVRISGADGAIGNDGYVVKANQYVKFRYTKDGTVTETNEYVTWYVNYFTGYTVGLPSGVSATN